ncbi:MAG: LLM class flavin-dependent oxidoreductase [Candidatus Binatia bacterium]
MVPETSGADGVPLLAALATQTTRIRLGSSILPIFMRSPTLVISGVQHLLVMPVTAAADAVMACTHTIEALAPSRKPNDNDQPQC